MKCKCPFCTEPQRPIYQHTDEALWWLVQTRDDIHDKRQRVYAYIHLFYRAGVFDPMMPYRVWLTVMGTEVDPPFAKNGIGAFQPPRLPDGTLLDPEWPWWDAVGRRMPWNESLPDGATPVRDYLAKEQQNYQEWWRTSKPAQRYTLN